MNEFRINKSELIDLIKGWLNEGCERFKSETTNGNSVQEKLSELCKGEVLQQEVREFFAFPELKHLKTKQRMFRVFDDLTAAEVTNTTVLGVSQPTSTLTEETLNVDPTTTEATATLGLSDSTVSEEEGIAISNAMNSDNSFD